jgi:hypothetical protein
MLAESGIPDVGQERLIECLTALERDVDQSAPVPGPELAALLGRSQKAAGPVPLPRRHRRVLVAGALAFGAVAAGGIAAAANELPPSAQDVVAEFSERFLPFELPRPEDRRPEPVEVDVPVPIDVYEPAPGDVLAPESAGTPAPPSLTTPAIPTPSAAPSPSASPSDLPSPGLLEPSGAGVVPSATPTTEPDGEAAEEQAGTDDGPQAAPGDEVTTVPTTGESSPPASPAPAPAPSAGPSAGSSPSPTVSSRRANGKKRAPGQQKEHPSDGTSGDMWSAG